MLKGDIRKQAILDVAEELFFSRGYTETTIQDMLDELGCSKGSFYHHYESKLQVLTALCRRREERHFAEYEKAAFQDNLSRLNGLVYYAMPFRKDEDKNIALLMQVEGMADAGVVYDAVLGVQKELFFPELCRVLEMLKAEGTVFYTQELLPSLLWDAYSAVYHTMMQAAEDIRQGGAPAQIVRLLEAERFMWERLLDAPFGSIELIGGGEALQTVEHAILRLRRRNHQA